MYENIHTDYRIFGYDKPDTTSTKLILFSVFTNDVENNPFNLELGAYYGTDSSTPINLKYLGMDGNFVKVSATKPSGNKRIIFFDKKWVEFNKNTYIGWNTLQPLEDCRAVIKFWYTYRI